MLGGIKAQKLPPPSSSSRERVFRMDHICRELVLGWGIRWDNMYVSRQEEGEEEEVEGSAGIPFAYLREHNNIIAAFVKVNWLSSRDVESLSSGYACSSPPLIFRSKKWCYGAPLRGERSYSIPWLRLSPGVGLESCDRWIYIFPSPDWNSKIVKFWESTKARSFHLSASYLHKSIRRFDNFCRELGRYVC